MRKVYHVQLFLVFLIFSASDCDVGFSDNRKTRHNNYVGADDDKDTCKSIDENITKVLVHMNVTKVTVSSVPQVMSKKDETFINIFELWKKFPIDIFINTSGTSMKCKNEHDEYVAAVLRNELIALKMFDASAKLPSGIFSGNINQYGDFDECLEVPNAHYCLVEIDLSPIWTKSLASHKELVHSHYNIKETFKDPGHRVPGFNFVRWGFCIPKSCTSDDVESALEERIGVKARVRPGLCQSMELRRQKLSFGDYFARIYFGFIFFSVGLGTFLYKKPEVSKPNNKWIKFLMAFSLQYNCNNLMRPGRKNEFKSVHGVRSLSALALLMAHKTMALLYNPYINRTRMSEMHGMGWSVIGRNAIIYTDCFLLISGLLNATALFDDLDKNKQKFKIKEKILNRLFRILPNLITIILFCTYILPLLGSGPLWPLIINHHSILCKNYMWRNILFIHNYYGFENMCLTHTHQLGIDMQLFLVTPIFVYAIWKLKSIGIYLIVVVALLSTVLRFWKTLEHDLSLVVHFGIPIARMFDTANFSYILPTHRATIYLIGVLLAHFLRNRPKKHLSKEQQIIIWILVYLAGLSTWFGPMNMSIKGYEYNRVQAAFYGAISPISWGLSVAWIIYSVEKGYKSWFGPLLTWKYFQIFTKISYGVYLIQFPVFFYNVGVNRHVGEFNNYMMLPPVETGVILLLSTVFTLFVEMPFQNIYKLFIK